MILYHGILLVDKQRGTTAVINGRKRGMYETKILTTNQQGKDNKSGKG